MSRGGLEE
jgi:hypothetical protein